MTDFKNIPLIKPQNNLDIKNLPHIVFFGPPGCGKTTIAKILDINLKQYNRPYDGEDLQPYWSKQKDKRDNPLAFYFKKKYALIDNEFKLYANENEKPRLFNLIKDPSEQLDFASQYPNKFKSLINTYQKWYNSVQKSNAGLDY